MPFATYAMCTNYEDLRVKQISTFLTGLVTKENFA